MNKTMLSVSLEFLAEKEIATFKQIYSIVSKELKGSWKKLNPKKLLADIELDKKAELYTLITVSGKFVKVSESKFGLSKNYTFEEVQKMKVNPDEEL